MKKYIVKDGDTMWSISKKTGIRLNLLVAANPQVRDPNQLQPGSVIMIPELTKSGESQNAGASVPGPKAPVSKAPVPKAAHKDVPEPDSPVPPYFGFVWPHVVKKGETWKDIADKYGISSAQLQHLNPKETPGTLDPGDIVYVPAFGFDGTESEPEMPTHGGYPHPYHDPGASPGMSPSPWPYSTGPIPGYAGHPGYPGHPGYAGYPGYPGYPVYPGAGYSWPQVPGGQPGMPVPPEHGNAPDTLGPHTHTPPRGDEYWWRSPDVPEYGYPCCEDNINYDPYLYRYGDSPSYGNDMMAADSYPDPYADGESFPDWGTTDFADVEIRNYELPPTPRSDSQTKND